MCVSGTVTHAKLMEIDAGIYLRDLYRFGPHGSAITRRILISTFCRNTPVMMQGQGQPCEQVLSTDLLTGRPGLVGG